MGLMSISGAGSGIDWHAMVDAMMDVERMPLERMVERRQRLDVQKTMWTGFKVSLSTVANRLSVLSQVNVFAAKETRVSNDEVATVRVDSHASSGQYQLQVMAVAQSHMIASERWEDPYAPGGWSGTFFINDQDVVVQDTDNLHDIAAKINAVDAAVQATIIDGNLVLTAEKTGLDNLMVLENAPEDTFLQDVGLLNESDEVANELRAAQDGHFTWDGLSITRSSNEVTDLLPGISLTVRGEGQTTITINEDPGPAMAAIRAWVDAYNSFMHKVETEGGESGSMRADSTLLRIEQGMRSLLMAPVAGGDGSFSSLDDIGISAGAASSQLRVDESQLHSALVQDAEGVMSLFFDPEDQVAGVGVRMQERIEMLISRPRGVITSQKNEIDRIMHDIDTSMERLTMRLEQRERRLIRQFVAMEEALHIMHTQSQWMMQWIEQNTPRQK